MRKILVTGAKGQLGTEICALAKGREEFIFTDMAAEELSLRLDICDLERVREFIEKESVGTIINCAAYTDVEGAEENRNLCLKINVDGPTNLAFAAKEAGAALVHISTDFVFDGKKKSGPYTEKSRCNPLSVYGESKLRSEKALMKIRPNGAIIRTSWLYSPYGKNFVKTMLNLGASRNNVNVVCDQKGSPTCAADLAAAIMKMLPCLNSPMEIFQYSNAGYCTWAEFATEIMRLGKRDCTVTPVTSAQYPQKAVRPAWSGMSKKKIVERYGVEVPRWKESLSDCIGILLNRD